MKNIKLNNGVEMPMIGFGTFQITDPEQCEKSVLTAIHAGYRLIDTAEAYGNEKYVGNAVRKCGIARDELFLTTKLNFNHFETETARETINRSLENLQTDYIDLVLLHWGFGNRYSAWRVLEEFYGQGKIRAIGVSNFEPDMLIDLIHFNKVTPALKRICTVSEKTLMPGKINMELPTRHMRRLVKEKQTICLRKKPLSGLPKNTVKRRHRFYCAIR